MVGGRWQTTVTGSPLGTASIIYYINNQKLIIMNTKKQTYLAPVVETFNARVERGFAGSGNETTLEPVTPGTIVPDDNWMGR